MATTANWPHCCANEREAAESHAPKAALAPRVAWRPPQLTYASVA